jgi:hypothetical protein
MIIQQIEGGRIIDCRSDDNCLFRDYRPLQPSSDSLPHAEMVEPRRELDRSLFPRGRRPRFPLLPTFRCTNPLS